MKAIKLLIFISLLTGGCSRPVPKNRTIFDSSICQPPCWQNITPGVTTKADALVKLSKIDFVEQPPIDMHHSSLGPFDDEIRFSAYKDHPTSGSIFISGNHVSIVTFEFNLGLTMQRAIDLFGTPESILVIHASFVDPITLLNAKKGVEFDYELFGKQSLDSASIEPDTEIFGVTFFDPNQFQKVLNSGILSAYTLTADQTIKNLRPWRGYGSFKAKYWPPATQPPP
jgi:hypothetical protein